MNRKGFTIIELLAVIVILSLVLVITIPTSIDAYKRSRLKAEDVFVSRLSQVIDSYVTLNTDNIAFTNNIGTKQKIDTENREVTVYKGIVTMNNLLSNKLITESDYIDPNNKMHCNRNAQIEVYRDSDYVYCHKVTASELSCITDDYINEYLNNNKNAYVIDTCVWREE